MVLAELETEHHFGFVFQLTDAKVCWQFPSCLQEIFLLIYRILGQIFAHLNLISCMSRCVGGKNTWFNEDKGQKKTFISIKLGSYLSDIQYSGVTSGMGSRGEDRCTWTGGQNCQ